MKLLASLGSRQKAENVCQKLFKQLFADIHVWLSRSQVAVRLPELCLAVRRANVCMINVEYFEAS